MALWLSGDEAATLAHLAGFLGDGVLSAASTVRANPCVRTLFRHVSRLVLISGRNRPTKSGMFRGSAVSCLAAGQLPVTLRDFAPPGTRSNARRPCDDPALVARLTRAAEMRHGWIGFVAAALPSPHKKRNGVQLRAETIEIVYELALDQGLSPRRAVTLRWSACLPRSTR